MRELEPSDEIASPGCEEAKEEDDEETGDEADGSEGRGEGEDAEGDGVGEHYHGSLPKGKESG